MEIREYLRMDEVGRAAKKHPRITTAPQGKSDLTPHGPHQWLKKKHMTDSTVPLSALRDGETARNGLQIWRVPCESERIQWG